ncbi:MAG: hypothetical protein LBI94_00290, partial [Treponema sp.]|nr:hypothetical protein [Treponema sp.]
MNTGIRIFKGGPRRPAVKGAAAAGVLLAAALFLGAPRAYGQTARPADDLVLKVVVYGPSDEIFIWWGHAALIVENTR